MSAHFVPTYHVAGESGICSWYGVGLAGAYTANGEHFDPNAMTAAHKTLPFNTKVKVKLGGHSVVVRINDRGPFVPGRILDVSPAAAKILDIVSKGIGPCEIEVVQ